MKKKEEKKKKKFQFESGEEKTEQKKMGMLTELSYTTTTSPNDGRD